MARLNGAAVDAVRELRLEAALVEQGYQPVADTPAAFAATIREDIAEWRRVVATAGLKFDP